jgi:glycosyltransferase involved in cell wall biosynthesis
MFGFIEALKRTGVQTVLFCISTHVAEPSRLMHVPSGATICLLPAPKRYRVLRRRMLYPYGQNVRHMFGNIRGSRKILFPFLFLLQETMLYLATPHRLLANEIQREGCNVILCQEYEYPRFDACVLLGKLLRLPVFATFQGGNYQHSHIERFLRPLSMQACAGLVIASQKEIQRVRHHYHLPPTKLAQIFNPVDLKLWGKGDRQEARSHLGIPEEAWVVAWHGRVSIHKKGLDILLEAWDTLRCNNSEQDIRLLLIGTGDGDAELRQRLKNMPVGSVCWIDRFIHDPILLRRHLSAADVYAFASRYEGFPVALVEAMACSLPVVATEIDGVVDILAGKESNGGLLVPSGDAAALALALQRVLHNQSGRETLGNSARRRVEKCCSFEAVGEQLQSFLFKQPMDYRSS